LSVPLQRLAQTRRSDCTVRSHVQHALEPLAKSHRTLSSICTSLAAGAASSLPSHQPSSMPVESGEVPSSATPSLAEGASKPVPSPALVRLGTVPLLGFQRIASPPTWLHAVLSHSAPKSRASAPPCQGDAPSARAVFTTSTVYSSVQCCCPAEQQPVLRFAPFSRWVLVSPRDPLSSGCDQMLQELHVPE
jgi:hypothetical protein